MSTPYSGNKDAVQAPNPAIAPGVTVTVSVPQDTDGNTVANFNNALRVPCDVGTYLLASSRPDFAVVNATGSSFTVPVNTALGGTITPSGSVHITDGTRFMIKIILGGAVGVATFQTSMDGGNTYGATQTTAASMTDATSGITLAFTGTFTINGTAAFRSAFTPVALWRDAGGSNRFQFDHLGYPTGSRISQHNFTLDNIAVWTAAGGAGSGVTFNLPSSSYNAGYGNINPSSTTLLLSTITTQRLLHSAPTGMSAVMEFESGLNTAGTGTTSNTSWFFGLGSTTDPSTDLNCIYLRKKYNAANYDLYTGNGAVISTQATSPATAPTAGTFPTDKIRIEVHGSASPYGAFLAIFIINGIVVGSVPAANLPASATLRMVFGSYNEGGAPSGSPNANVGSWPQLVWNRYSNPSGI